MGHVPTDQLSGGEPEMDPDCWPQIHITWRAWRDAENAAAEQLWPHLKAAEGDGSLTQWWFARKFPHWRLRYRDDCARPRLESVMEKLAAQGTITQWTHGIYEPETLAFGGPLAMETAHALFHADSCGVLVYLVRRQAHPQSHELGRRELGVLLLSVLLRGAGLDWYEQGDVWARVANLRPSTSPPLAADRLREQVRQLMTVDVAPLTEDGPLIELEPWIRAQKEAGRRLAELATDGLLERGTRAILAHHVIFAWNRLGLPAADQSVLSRVAREVVMSDPTPQPATTPMGKPEEAQRLRSQLVDDLRQQGHVSDERVAAAVGAVPRHLFVPDATLQDAYANTQVHTKHDEGGTSISCASLPSVVTMMLQQLDLTPGQRVLEVGAGTGYNAALLAHLTSPGGHVTTIDVDDDIVAQARVHLADAGIGNVEVVRGDGAAGHRPGALYDRITATVGAYDIPLAWLAQLAPAGRLVVPVRIAGDASRSLALERQYDHWASVDVQMCTFMPLRDSAASDPRRVLDLTGDGAVTLQANQDQHIDAVALHGVLDEEKHEVWTGVTFGSSQSFGDIWLWLACALENSLSRMPVTRAAVESGLVAPMLPWGSMATAAVDERGLAYLTRRPFEGRYEIGVISHAKAGHLAAEQMAAEVTAWQTFRDGEVHVSLYPALGTAPQPALGRFVLRRPNAHLVVTWRP
jgi:protein-L-isoaspartate(D-aspartate) O-methyltransferase